MAAVMSLDLEYDLRVIFQPCVPVHGLSEVLDRNNPNVANELAQFHARDGTTANEPQLAGKAGDIITKPASLFSGTMRLLLQDHYSKCRDTAVPYDYRFSTTTHGIMLTPGDGAPWLIAISRTEGVFARRIEVAGSLTRYTGTPSDESAFAFDPVLAALPPYSDISWRVLANAATLFGGGALEGIPWADEGWAFSYDGRSAAIVLVATQGLYWYTRLMRINIALSTDVISTPGGDVTIDVPGAATLETVEEGFLWQHLDGTSTRLKHPDGPGISAQIHSRDDLSAGQLAPPAASSVCPVFAFFDKGNDLQVARWHHETETTTPGTLAVTTSTACYSTPGTGVEANEAKAGEETTFERGQQLTGWVEHGSAGGQNNFVAPTSTTARFAYRDPYAHIEHRRSGVADSRIVEDVLVLPLLDREAMYHERRTRTRSAETGSTRTFLAWRADTERARSYRQPIAPTIASAVAAGQRIAIINPEPLTAPFDLSGTFALFPTEIALAGRYFGGGFTGDTGTDVARQAVDAWAAGFTTVSDATVTGVAGTLEQEGITRETYAASYTHSTAGPGQAAPSTVVTEAPEAIFGPPGAIPTVDDETITGTSTETVVVAAHIDGSVVSAQWTLTDAEHDDWQRKTGSFSGQEWLVTQDANDGGRFLYSSQPRPEGGTLGQVLAGSAAYTPGARTSELLAWVGRP